jgi:hypothetical protein
VENKQHIDAESFLGDLAETLSVIPANVIAEK